jgi:ubiquinone/menaquinone biosynthesis C-methylase UbiE
VSADPQFSAKYAECYDLLHTSKTYGEEVDLVIGLASDALGHKPAHVLDLACGTGVHLVEFAQRGLSVHGNDLSSGMLERSERRLMASGVVNYHLTLGPMQDVPAEQGSVELAAAFYTALGYLVDPVQLHRFFRHLHSILKPGGCFFADLWNMHKMAVHYSPSRNRSAENENLSVHRTSSVSNVAARNALEVQFNFDVDDKRSHARDSFSETHLVRYHTVSEMENLLLAHGFSLLKSGPLFDEATRTEDAWNFFVFAQRS